jgi:nucleotide-binding universal stress UspA family protein
MRYLVATDGSPESDEAVEYAVEHALAFDATLELVHVITPGTKVVEGEAVFEGEEGAEESGRRTLETARRVAEEAAEAAGETISVESELLLGRPAHAVTDYAEEVDADAVFVGHRGLSSEREKVVGSVAKGIVDEADRPVTVVR